MRALVTGCYGFIGSHLVKQLLCLPETIEVIGLARDSNQQNKLRLESIKNNSHFRVIHGDIQKTVDEACEGVDVIFHLAAKTFVDHSIRDMTPFVQDNVLGTIAVLEAAKLNKVSKVIVQSTDEVYGQILEGAYKEDARLNPRNPYSASKAAADMFALAYQNTYGLNVCIARIENVFGPYQNPQKVIPNFVRRALLNEALPVYGDGMHVRQWIHVDDNVAGLLVLMGAGFPGEIYHIAGNKELTNLALARIILKTLGKPEDQIKFIEDHNIRPGHDRRYALDSTKIRSMGWEPKWGLEEGLYRVIRWYQEKYSNREWY